MGKWMRANGPALLMLTFVFLLALFVRSYFAYDMSVENDYLVSGGSDSYYWRRIIDYHVETGDSLFKDPLLNYPTGLVNPRPPFFSMSVAVPAVLMQGLFESVDDAAGFFFVWSTAFWGALTVVPVYFLGKETFGRRVGMAAALLFAVVPAHVQRSVLSNADHDSLILFLIVTIFYFLLRAIRLQEHRKWVEKWSLKDRKALSAGFKGYFAGSRTALLYALMAGTMYGLLMMTWVGFAYVTVIILVYYVVQLFINMFRGQDSMSITMLILVMMGFGYLLAFPYYVNYTDYFFNDRFLVPFLLSAGGLLFGLMFVVSRDYPWTISLPSIAGISAAILAVVAFFYPWLGEAILTGQGYFSTSKLYSTIAEARAPQFSELALSFGMVTFFMSLAGLLYAVTRIPKRTGSEYVFIVVWLMASIFMAISAGRFMFNAAPAFAIAAGWVFVIIVDALDFNSVRRSMVGASGSFFSIMRKSIKIRHVVGVLFLAFLILLPNIWYSVDAGIPSETKRSYDKEIYLTMPSFMRPGDYDAINGSNWYLGAFGYSLPLPSYYYPAAWDWFSQQDSDVYPVSSKPAYVAWWDYGFEAIAEGEHPTVADNFQNGYQFTGNFIMAQSEHEAVALFALRLVRSGLADETIADDVLSLLEAHGFDSGRIHEIATGPTDPIIEEVLSDPDLYGPMSSDLSAENARIVAGRAELQKLDMGSVVALYADLCELTGYEIRYFNVDSRMFPISAYSTGIFYAPAKLSDRRIEGSTPVDFFNIVAVDANGVAHAIEDVTSDMAIQSYDVKYFDMFYDSMFYRAMCGVSGSDIGLENIGLPGVSGSVQKASAMPGWNLTHFKVVYRTAYYNPYPSDELAYHSSAWRAISYDEALALNKQISLGEATGVVDYSASSLYRSGTVFLKYYHGAYVNGTVTTENGYPAAGLWVTVQDEYGIPHHQVKTDSEGRYSVLAPFGNVTVVISYGAANNQGLVGSNTVGKIKVNVTDDQAMRVKQDLDGDGVFDYIFTKDFVMADSRLNGDLYWDNDREGNFTSDSDEFITGGMVYAVETTSELTYEFDASGGSYEGYVPPGQYDLYALVMGANLTVSEAVNVTASATVKNDLGLLPTSIYGYVWNSDGSLAEGVELVMDDVFSDATFTAVTEEGGMYLFTKLIGSTYEITTTAEDKMLFGVDVTLEAGTTSPQNMTLWDRCEVEVRATVDGSPAAYSAYVFRDNYNPDEVVSGITDRYGWIREALPPGDYSLQVIYTTGSGSWSAQMLIDLFDSTEVTGTLAVQKAFRVTGSLLDSNGIGADDEDLTFVSETGARVSVVTDYSGAFEAFLPAGEYEVVVTSINEKEIHRSHLSVSQDVSGYVVAMSEGVKLAGYLYKDADGDLSSSVNEKAPYANLRIIDSHGYVYTSKSGSTSWFSVIVPRGEAVTISLADPGYRSWSMDVVYDEDDIGMNLLVTADDVEVAGYLTSDSQGLSGITISFIPVNSSLPSVEAVTDHDGSYSATMVPTGYTVRVDQELENTPGTWYQNETSLVVRPSGSVQRLDVDAALRVFVHGTVLGAAQDIRLEFSGPETVTLDLGSEMTYSVYLELGTYSVYATGEIGLIPYASMELREVSPLDAEHDFVLERAYTVSGAISLDGVKPDEPVMVIVNSDEGVSIVNKSQRSGEYYFQLPNGEYAITFVYEDAYDTGETIVYVEYWSEALFTVASAPVTIDPALDERYDNATVDGSVVDEDGDPITAFIEMLPSGGYGLYAAFATDTSGEFSAEVQPGEYTVYVTRLVDMRVSVSSVYVTRNVGASMEIQLSIGQYLEGRLVVAGLPSTEEVTASGAGTVVPATPAADGYFQFLLPSGSYNLTSSATRVEGGLSVTYGLTKSVELGDGSMYVDFTLIRDTRYLVKGTWDEGKTATLAPGQTISYLITVENTGNIADTYEITYTGTAFVAVIEPGEVWIDFGSNGNIAYVVAELTVTDTAPAGNNTASVSIVSQARSSARATVALVVNVLPSRSVSVENLNESGSASTTVTTTKFRLNNTGNIEDDFMVSVSNPDFLNISGWSARIVDPDTGEAVTNLTLAAFSSKELAVEFRATRSTPDPVVEAVVMAYSTIDGSVTGYGAVPVMLSDLVLGPGDLEVVRDDVTYEYDYERLFIDIGLAVSLAVLVVVFFVMRRRKGLGGGGKK